MNPQPIPNIHKAITMIRHVLSERAVHNELELHCIVFEADVLHMDRFGRQIYGERYDISWHGPRAAILTGILTGDRSVLSLAENRDEMAMLDPLDPKRGSFMASPGIDRLNAINAERPLELDEDGVPDPMSVSEIEVIREVMGNPTRGQFDALERMLRHPCVLRSDGISVKPEDMLDPSHPKHECRIRQHREEAASTRF